MPDALRLLLETRSAVLSDLDRAEGAPERLLVLSDLTGTMQCYELAPPGEAVQLTALGEPVRSARYAPGSRQAVIEVDRGGDERYQLYVLDLDAASRSPVTSTGELAALTCDPRFGHHLAGISPDGRRLAYLSNRANGVDFDLWLLDLETLEHRLLHASGAYCWPASGFSPDGRLVSLLRPGPRPLDVDLVLVDVETGAHRTVLQHPEQAALVGAPAFVDERRFFVSSDVGRDLAAVVSYDLASDSATVVPGTGEHHDAAPATSGDGSRLLVVENRDGASALFCYDPATGALGEEIRLAEDGVVSSVTALPLLSADGSWCYYSLSTPRLAGDVWAQQLPGGARRRLTVSPSPVDPEQLALPELARVESFDGEQIPLFLYRPQQSEGPPPVVVLVHGGPESQSFRNFRPIIQGLVAGGYAVVVPNVRGSTGYGKRYAALDDTTKRLDSVRDLAAVHGVLAGAGLDPGRAALWGASYGGYMVLAGLAFQPELWAAGVDVVGISDLVTFLEHTSEYRRAFREREYGSLNHDREFLECASPLRRVDAISAPLFIVHGRNDPRVPVGEAEQLAESLRRRDVRCELVIYEDEGHGLARLANRLDAYPRAAAFLDEVLKRNGPVP